MLKKVLGGHTFLYLLFKPRLPSRRNYFPTTPIQTFIFKSKMYLRMFIFVSFIWVIGHRW